MNRSWVGTVLQCHLGSTTIIACTRRRSGGRHLSCSGTDAGIAAAWLISLVADRSKGRESGSIAKNVRHPGGRVLQKLEPDAYCQVAVIRDHSGAV